MKYILFLTLASLVTLPLVGCGTGISMTAPVSSRAQSKVAASESCLTNSCIYVSTSSKVVIYATTGTGDATPLETMFGSGMSHPTGIAVNANRNIAISNDPAPRVLPYISVYAPGEYGSVTPIALIHGSETGLTPPNGLALDAIGDVYVANDYNIVTDCQGPFVGEIPVFKAGSKGNVFPVATIRNGLDYPLRIAVDTDRNVYVLNNCDAGITIYSPSGGGYSLVRTIAGPNTDLTEGIELRGISVDSKGNIYVVWGGSSTLPVSVLIFAAGSNGNVAPTAIITGSETKLVTPVGVALDSVGRIYVLDDGLARFRVFVYASGSNGNVKPIQDIEGVSLPNVSDARAIAVQ